MFRLKSGKSEKRGVTMAHIKKRILVVSSANMDFVMNMHTLPSAGQTLIDHSGSYALCSGRKGANSAVTIQRLGVLRFLRGSQRRCQRRNLKGIYEKEGIDTRFYIV